MKAKARDGHATIITCIKRVTHVMIVACLSLAFAFMLHTGFACIYCIHLVPVLFSIVIPTSFNILMKCFSHLFFIDRYMQ